MLLLKIRRSERILTKHKESLLRSYCTINCTRSTKIFCRITNLSKDTILLYYYTQRSIKDLSQKYESSKKNFPCKTFDISFFSQFSKCHRRKPKSKRTTRNQPLRKRKLLRQLSTSKTSSMTLRLRTVCTNIIGSMFTTPASV